MALFNEETTLGRMNDLIKVGEVSSIDPARGTARVVFDDEESLVSYDLPVIQRNTLETKDFHSPSVGEDVLCLFLPSGPEEGFILGSFYAGEIKPPESTKTRRTTVFEDGTVVQYDMAAHRFTILIDGTSIVFDRASGTITVPDAYVVNCATAVVNAKESMTINTPTTNITGALNVSGLITGKGGLAVSGGSGGAAATVTGTLKTTGDVVAGDVSLQGHVHTEQGDGADTSPAH